MLSNQKLRQIIRLLKQSNGITITQIQRKVSLGYSDVKDIYLAKIQQIYNVECKDNHYKIV